MQRKTEDFWAIRAFGALLATAVAWTSSCGGQPPLASVGEDAGADIISADAALSDAIPERTAETSDTAAHDAGDEATRLSGRDAAGDELPIDAAVAEEGAAQTDAARTPCALGTADGMACTGPGDPTLQSGDICLGGYCLMPAGFPGCRVDADCVPGGCLHGFPAGDASASVCMGTAGIPAVVSCGDEVVSCSTDTGCSISETTHRACGRQGQLSTFSTCDGPSDCPADQDCCMTGSGFGSLNCFPRADGGVSSGCPAATGGRHFWICDPREPTRTCPEGLTCKGFDFATAAFTCSP